MNKYYVYLHVKLTNGEPFYVGKGSGRRAFNKHNRSVYWKRIVDKYGYDIIFLEDNLTEEESFELETYWIMRIGRIDLGSGTLINYSDGGYGGTRRKLTEEHKRKLSEANKGQVSWAKGVKKSDETKKKISLSRIGTKGHRKGKMFKKGQIPWNKGKKMSEESRKKMSDSRKGKYPWNKGLKLKKDPDS